MTRPIVGGIEAGGTKFVCAIGRGRDEVYATTTIPTVDPRSTLIQANNFFREQEKEWGALSAVGIGSFGPLDLNPVSPSYGSIVATPKPGWSDTNIGSYFREQFGVPVVIDTDVNIAAFGEWRWGAAQGLDNFVYLTVGTGIGGGGMINGRLMHGMTHPEMGHMRIPREFDRDDYQGSCPYHGNCLEGLACGPAIEKRWGQKPELLPSSHPAWKLEAYYIGMALVNIICILSPQKIILGGGVMQQSHLYPFIQAEVRRCLNGYIQSPLVQSNIEDYIVSPSLGSQSGVLGAMAIAIEQIES